MSAADHTRRPRRWLTRTLLGGVLAASALLVPDATPAPVETTLVATEAAQDVDLGQDVLWVLLVGSDARPGEDMTRTRGDALHLVGVDLRTHAATDIGIPRDSYVDIPGVGRDKINASLYYGGPELLGRTVGDLVGVQPQYVFVTRFPKFIDLVRTIGPITVDNPVAFSDTYLKPKGFRAGRITLPAYDAMAFSRIRHDLIRGDFDRSANQQRVIRGIQRKVHDNAGRPGFIARGVASVMRNLYTDLPPTTLFKLAWALAQIDPAKVTGCVVQGSIGNIGGASVVLPYTDQARSYGDQARKDATIEQC